MNPPPNYNTLALLNSSLDASYIVLLRCFSLLKPIRRKYRLSVNQCIIIIGMYVYHCYKGSIFSCNGIVKLIRYYDSSRITWYIEWFIKHNYVVRAEVIKGIQYYKLTERGVQVSRDFNEEFMSILYKWYNDNGVTP